MTGWICVPYSARDVKTIWNRATDRNAETPIGILRTILQENRYLYKCHDIRSK